MKKYRPEKTPYLDTFHPVPKSVEKSRNSHSQMFLKLGALKNFAIFKGKQQCWSIFLIKLQAFWTSTLLERNSSTGVFLRILRIS